MENPNSGLVGPEMNQNSGSTQTPPQQNIVPETQAPAPKKTGMGIFLWIILLLGLVLISAALYLVYKMPKKEAQQVANEGPNVQRIMDQGKMVVAIDATFEPMEFIDPQGEFNGYDVDLANKIGEELGVDIEFKNIEWDFIFDTLKDGGVDAIISSASITDERREIFDFSNPYINAGQVIVTRKDNQSIITPSDLQGKKIGVQNGTTNEEEAKKYTDSSHVILFDDFIQATEDLIAGKIDAIFADLTGAKGIIDQNPELRITGEPITTEYYGIVFQQGQEDLVRKIDGILENLRQRGFLVSLKQKWLE